MARGADDIYPGAVWRPITEADTQAEINPTQIILHSAAGGGSLWRFWQFSTGLESTFWVPFNGPPEQYLYANVRADANLTANVRAISFESESSISATEPWTPSQVEEIIKACVWACRRYGIPPVPCPTHSSPGIGYHIMFGAPGPWAPRAKSCPGPARIKQFPGIVAEVARRLGVGEIPPTIPPHTEDLTIVDDATKRYLDQRFDALDASIGRSVAAEFTAIDEARKAAAAEAKRDAEAASRETSRWAKVFDFLGIRRG